MNNFFVLTGENTWQIDQEAKRWQESFIAKHGEDNLVHIDTAETSWLELLQEISTMPFLAERRLVILNEFPKCTDETVEKFLQAQHPQVVILCKNPKIDKRLKTHKILLKAAEVQEFKVLTPKALEQWLQAVAQSNGATFDSAALQYILKKVGNDQQMLENEVQKLALYAPTIIVANIQLLSVALAQQELWGLTNCLGKGDVYATLRYIDQLLEQGESPMGIWTIVLWLISNIQLMTLAAADGVESFQVLMKEYKVAFGPAKSCSPIVQALHRSSTANTFFTEVLEYDTAMKTGGIQSATTHQEEVIACIQHVLLRLCSFATVS